MCKAFVYEESYHAGRDQNYQRVGTRFIAEFNGDMRSHLTRIDESSVTNFANVLSKEKVGGVTPVAALPPHRDSVEWLSQPKNMGNGKLAVLVLREPLKLSK